MKNYFTYLGLILALGGLTACSEADGTANKLLARGRIDTAMDAQATTVTASELEADGSETPVESDSSSVDEDSRYVISSDARFEAGTYILIEATDGNASASVVVRVDADGEVTAEPMNEETTLEAELYASTLVAADCDSCSPEAIRATVDAELAATYAGAQQSAETFADLRASVAARIEAEATVVEEQSSAQAEAYAEARIEAQAEASAALDAATTADAIAVAQADYELALDAARDDAGITAEAWAEAAHAGAEAARMEAETMGLDASLYAQMVADAEMERAEAVQAAIYAELEASGMTGVNVDAAFSDLMLAIEGARDDGASASTNIATAWESAALSISAELSATLGSTESTAFDSWTTFSATALTTLRADILGIEGSVEAALALTKAMSEYQTDVSALVTVGVDASVADSFARILLHLEFAASAS